MDIINEKENISCNMEGADNHWDSIEAIKSEFGILNAPDAEAVREELRKKITFLHPDVSGGAFPSDESKDEFHKVSAAIKWIDSRKPQQIGHLNIGVALQRIERQLGALSLGGNLRSGKARVQESVEGIRRISAKSYRVTRIRSGVFAFISSAIVGFSQVIKGNPVFEIIIKNAWVTGILFVVFVLAGSMFLISWLNESRVSNSIDWLLSEEGLTYLVKGALEYEKRNDSSNNIITKRAMAQQAFWFKKPWHKQKIVRWIKQLFWGRISTPVAEALSEVQLEELIRRGVVKHSGFRGIEPKFTIDPERVSEIENDNAYFFGD